MQPILPSLVASAALILAFPALGQDVSAEAEMMNAQGQSLGVLSLTETDAGVHVTGTLTGVEPGEHGFHIHETGNCDAVTNFETAGAHFEPGDQQHGFANPEGPHAGDIRNITAPESGEAVIDSTNAMVTLGEGEASLFDADGSAIVLHARPDDYATDPSGNSGDRIACGVIEAAQG